MKKNISFYAKIFDPALLSKAMQTFDKATMLIVSVCWGSALLLILFALYTVDLSVAARRQVVEAAATEPALPKIITQKPEAKEMTILFERLQKRFSDIAFGLGSDQALTVSAVDGGRFRTWLTVLSYIDTISPQYRWNIRELCVGAKCRGGAPMRAVLEAKKITFEIPTQKS